jgi:L-alanine-DL-glutamate epimerase-like enolase superfamily enzyme
MLKRMGSGARAMRIKPTTRSAALVRAIRRSFGIGARLR